ncbi:alpha/beta hydrolase [Streptomyces sp. NPDC052114]|uniref:alpha/beta fold hydrolase n=1 Tax=unclassified Streptomyces TaxID=2593676 RepID=UPI0034378E1A
MPVIELSGGPVEYRRVEGRAGLRPLVFLHEGLGCVAMWGRFPDALARATGRPALVYSRHGYGGSGPARVPRPVTYMHDEAARVLPELLDRLSVTEPVLVGHSDGASIALLHARLRPVGAAVVLAPHVFVEPETLAGIRRARAAFGAGELSRRLARFHDTPDTVFGAWSDVWLSPEFRDWNIEESLPGITSPTLLIQGDRDEYATLRQLDALERGLGGPVRRVEVPDCGHSPHLERSAETQDAIVRFLADSVPD